VTDRTWFLLFGSVNIHLHFGPISEFWQARRSGAFNALIKHSGLAASTALALFVTHFHLLFFVFSNSTETLLNLCIANKRARVSQRRARSGTEGSWSVFLDACLCTLDYGF
jgi:hypothetical protein